MTWASYFYFLAWEWDCNEAGAPRDPFSGLRRMMELARSCRVAADRLQMSEWLLVDGAKGF